MSSIPTQAQMDGLLDDLEHSLGRLRELWRWAAPSIYDRPRRAGMNINPHTVKASEDFQMKPKSAAGSGSEDPVGDLVAQTERFRTKARHAAREVRDARNRLGTAIADLNDALRLLDPPPGPEVADVRLLPHPAAKIDLAQARAAQARRAGRARRSGDYDEVTG